MAELWLKLGLHCEQSCKHYIGMRMQSKLGRRAAGLAPVERERQRAQHGGGSGAERGPVGYQAGRRCSGAPAGCSQSL